MLVYGPYAAVVDFLYLAFVPQKERGRVHGRTEFFMKLGYRELVRGSDHGSFVCYVEKKSAPLQLTNVPGAGIFVFEAPANHKVFSRPARAAEASLKTELLHSTELTVTPTGHCADVGSFSTSLEYFFIEAAGTRFETLAALTRLLRNFTYNPNLLPMR